MIAALFSLLPVASAAYYANSSSVADPVTTSDVEQVPVAFQSSSVATPIGTSTSSQDLTTYVTIEQGRTITVTTPKAQVSATPAPVAAAAGSSSSVDLTTYVTVEMGKTITVTTAKAQPTSSNNAPQFYSSADLTTYVTIEMGKTITVTTQKSQPTGVEFAVNKASAAGNNAAKLAAIAGAGAAAFLI